SAEWIVQQRAQSFGRDRLGRSLVCRRLNQGGLGTTSSTPPVACFLAVSAIKISRTRESICQPIARPKRPPTAMWQPRAAPTRPAQRLGGRMLACSPPARVLIGGRDLDQHATQLATGGTTEEPSPRRSMKRPTLDRHNELPTTGSRQLALQQP